MTNKLKGNIMLLLCAMIWGCAFVAQSKGMDYVGPFTFQSIRSIIGCVVLIPVIFLSDAMKKRERGQEAVDKNMLIPGGIICGAVLCAASCFQQIGIAMDASAGDAGFITALYILIVPIIGLFMGRRANIKLWIGVLLALFGLYLMTGRFSGFTMGCLMVLVSAFLYAIHIMVVDYYSPKVDGVRLSCIQFLVSGIISGVFMLIIERPEISSILSAYLPILYAGVMSCGVAYTLQILGQKYTEPTVASMLMSLESVFALIAGMLLQPDENPLKLVKILGCALIFGAIVLAQLPERKKL